MKYIRNNSTDPYYNLAFEEYVFHTFKDDDYILLWQNDRTVVVGKHQNTVEEVNLRRAGELGIKIVRRNSGGGAVYHDMGNLNFSFITGWNPDMQTDYDTFLIPVIRALSKIGVHAGKKGRNDLVVGGRKISGSAQCIHDGRLLHHGTLLIDSDLDVLSEVLNVQADKFLSKGVKSVRSRVANISEFAKTPCGAQLLMQLILESCAGDNIIDAFVPDNSQISHIEALAKKKYATREWNYGFSTVYSYRNSKRFPSGKIEVHVNVMDGMISQCKIFGDFMALTGVEDLEDAITGSRADRKALKGALEGFDIRRRYGFTLEELLECFEGIA